MACVFTIRNPRQELYEEDYDFLLGKITNDGKAIAGIQPELVTIKQQLARVLSVSNVTTPTTPVSDPPVSSSPPVLPPASASIPNPLTVAMGGTGGTTPASAQTGLGLGTAATYNVPVTGNASASEVVKGNDTRLTLRCQITLCQGITPTVAVVSDIQPVLPYGPANATINWQPTFLYFKSEVPVLLSDTIDVVRGATGDADFGAGTSILSATVSRAGATTYLVTKSAYTDFVNSGGDATAYPSGTPIAVKPSAVASTKWTIFVEFEAV